MVTIYDTYPQMTSLAGAPFGLGAWRRYAEGIYPAHPGTESFREKIEADVRGYDFEAQIRPVLEAALAEPPELEAAHASFLQAAEGLAEKLAEMLPGMPDVDVVFYLGLCNGAGWATAFRGKRTVLIGVEKVLELSWGGAKDMEALLYHELGHIWHEARLGGWPEMQTQAERSLFQLYREGIAMRCEQLLCGDDAFYHQDRGDHGGIRPAHGCGRKHAGLFRRLVRLARAFGYGVLPWLRIREASHEALAPLGSRDALHSGSGGGFFRICAKKINRE